eukprot:CAMPEP_0170736850 /NCGR_PEP_ID=MMETSP0437-20130122/3824_1 /TAXON_ID=0 /ORGANISM="Sexangularia sp." /LENGTH=673 /DNA_ID=CAMNT_0011075219 /DNA_START=12 /DNA_END=2033 /DNA_ORIENTATION=-
MDDSSEDSLDLDAGPIFAKSKPPAARQPSPVPATNRSPDLADKVLGANSEFLRRITERRRLEAKVRSEAERAVRAEAEAEASTLALQRVRAEQAAAAEAERLRTAEHGEMDELGQKCGPDSPDGAPSIESQFGAEARDWAAAIVPVSRCAFGIVDPSEVQAVTTGLVQHWLGLVDKEGESGQVTPTMAWLRGTRRCRSVDQLALTVRDVAARNLRADRDGLDREIATCVGRSTSHPPPNSVTFPFVSPYDQLTLHSLAHSSTVPIPLSYWYQLLFQLGIVPIHEARERCDSKHCGIRHTRQDDEPPTKGKRGSTLPLLSPSVPLISLLLSEPVLGSLTWTSTDEATATADLLMGVVIDGAAATLPEYHFRARVGCAFDRLMNLAPSFAERAVVATRIVSRLLTIARNEGPVTAADVCRACLPVVSVTPLGRWLTTVCSVALAEYCLIPSRKAELDADPDALLVPVEARAYYAAGSPRGPLAHFSWSIDRTTDRECWFARVTRALRKGVENQEDFVLDEWLHRRAGLDLVWAATTAALPVSSKPSTMGIDVSDAIREANHRVREIAGGSVCREAFKNKANSLDAALNIVAKSLPLRGKVDCSSLQPDAANGRDNDDSSSHKVMPPPRRRLATSSGLRQARLAFSISRKSTDVANTDSNSADARDAQAEAEAEPC